MRTGPDLRNSTQGDWLDGWSPTCKRLPPFAARRDQQVNALVKKGNALLTIRLHRPAGPRPSRAKRAAEALVRRGVVGAGGVEPPSSFVSANTGNRCARRRSPRSSPTVEAEGKRSLDVQLNALFRHFDPTAMTRDDLRRPTLPPSPAPPTRRPLWLSGHSGTAWRAA